MTAPNAAGSAPATDPTNAMGFAARSALPSVPGSAATAALAGATGSAATTALAGAAASAATTALAGATGSMATGAPMAPPSASAPAAVRFMPAQPEDLATVSHLLLRAIPDCIPQTVDQLSEGGAEIWVARDGEGTIVASASLVPMGDRRWEIRSVIVDPSCRGTGVGRRLISHLIGLRSLRNQELYCVTRHPRFFRRFGFEPLVTPWEKTPTTRQGRRRVSMRRAPKRRAQ